MRQGFLAEASQHEAEGRRSRQSYGLYQDNEQRLEFMQIPAENAVGKLGYWPRKSFEYYVDAYYESGWIGTCDIDIDQMYTNDLIADINDFSEDDVRSKARAAK